ncbi:MAG: hypothetical protein A2275_18775 [Bacteroidetes bacterium RIFOXYA12_FULL_35_11]|nr:MAG: hypothetical protein A2X01_06590 [Bacteroidetes bacterium GWF2_35_48]OFY74324.1 MAG: hypothetical protein A2275_18775 [Bacteroidetes bacterium RIFOXYA12_FULL_35_11]OFY93602.1 MAG: hypothetical protein A2491_01015 [Bacteroidetes bacterium RIFOXYC12_FULL_35_7]OFY93991.1 MAG: hypothetical protein A2309_09645 [Bacteroidetes bacterium RIFOXYB2_FULL_35_7]HBX49679.1 hypothetical protein [Bacteroidales bacterium]
MKEKTESVIRKVRNLYVKKGIKNVTMDDVASHLGISKKTLYTFFSDKDKLVEDVLFFHISEFNTLFMGLAAQKMNAIEKLYKVSELVGKLISSVPQVILNDLQKYHPEVLTRFIEFKRSHILLQVKKNIEEGLKEGLYRKNIDPEIASRSYLALSETLFDKAFFPDGKYNSGEVFNELFMYHIRGIASEKGMAYIDLGM